MEIVQEFSNQFMLYIPVALVIVGAVLVFAFGFKSVEQPSFHNLTNDERKSLGKKKKLKEKKSSVNGQVLVGDHKNEKSPKKSAPKETAEPKLEKKEKKTESKQQEKTKKPDVKAKVNVEEVKVKKNSKKVVTEKPTDFDEGDWEMVPSKSDKKKKTEQSPTTKDKKTKKNEKVQQPDTEKLLKEIDNKEKQLEDVESTTEKEALAVEPKVEKIIPNDEPVVIEEKKEKKKKEKKPTKDAEDSVNNTGAKEETEQLIQPSKVDVLDKDENSDKPVAPVFDELGDTWTEAKAVKKSKKKARRDN